MVIFHRFLYVYRVKPRLTFRHFAIFSVLGGQLRGVLHLDPNWGMPHDLRNLRRENCTQFPSYRIHGAAIYGNMDPINLPPILAYLPAPWILWAWFQGSVTTWGRNILPNEIYCTVLLLSGLAILSVLIGRQRGTCFKLNSSAHCAGEYHETTNKWKDPWNPIVTGKCVPNVWADYEMNHDMIGIYILLW